MSEPATLNKRIDALEEAVNTLKIAVGVIPKTQIDVLPIAQCAQCGNKIYEGESFLLDETYFCTESCKGMYWSKNKSPIGWIYNSLTKTNEELVEIHTNPHPFLIDKYSRYISKWRQEKGFITPLDPFDVNNHTKLLLIISEIIEATEALRDGDMSLYKEELADALIRIFDLNGTQNLNLEQQVKNKMVFNEKRPPKHGRRF